MHDIRVSVLFNEPKLLKLRAYHALNDAAYRFSALQRAEIAEIAPVSRVHRPAAPSFSALQRAEIAEIEEPESQHSRGVEFQCSSTSRNC